MKKRVIMLQMMIFMGILLGATAIRQDSHAFAAQTEEMVHLRDNAALYAQDEDLSVETMYLTVFRGEKGSRTDHSWAEINAYSVYDYEEMGVERYQMYALLQAGDEKGPRAGEIGYGAFSPNATVQIRGQSASESQQKSYKIELFKGAGTWRNQRTIALNKHPWDTLRFRNKLAFDLLEEIEQLIGLRTQFVHLYVKDTTGDNPQEFVDYGLYTQVEQLNKTALRAHGLDDGSHLYKVNFFEFYRYEDVIRLETDPAYDLGAFEQYLEVKGNSDHRKLIAMLEDVNDASLTPDEVIARHFDPENLAYYLAFEILLGNTDTQSRNMYLYSPSDSQRWYIIPWDHDMSLSRGEYAFFEVSEQSAWEVGISNYWGNMLFRRCLLSDSFRARLDAAMAELSQRMTEEELRRRIEGYVSVVKPYVYAAPDVDYCLAESEVYDALAAQIPQEAALNERQYVESWEKPMPFYIGDPWTQEGKLMLSWDPAYDFDGEAMFYRVEVARDCGFEDVICAQEGLTQTELTLDTPEPGEYYVRICATNASGYSQYAFDYVVTEQGKHYGTRAFSIQADGTAVP